MQTPKSISWCICLGLLFVLSNVPECLPGGVIEPGGLVDGVSMVPSATFVRGAPYEIVCYDHQEAERREQQTSKSAPVANAPDDQQSYEEQATAQGPPVTYVPLNKYAGGCEEEGQSSTFFLFNMFPVTPILNPEYAIGTVVQRLEGDTMVNIRIWHETHYYSLLGRVSVFRIRGDVIKFLSPVEKEALESQP